LPEPGFFRFRFRVPAHLHDDFSAAVWTETFLGLCASANGDPERLDCYFLDAEGPPPSAWTYRKIELVSCARVVEVDWLEHYREAAEPFDVGVGYRVDPREPGLGTSRDAGRRRLLRIPARRAFGTGSHESTWLAIELLENLDLKGRRVLDYGSGSGILALISLDRGARVVVGVDNDVESVFCSRENSRLNGLRPSFAVATLDSFDRAASFDVLVVNILPGRILHQMNALTRLVAPGGRLVYSGAMVSQGGEVAATLLESGLEIAERRCEGEWLAVGAVKGEPS
jgi:ribosomal protein L11 methyltransferase